MKILAIVGNGRTRFFAPHDDHSREIWTMNNHAMLWNRRTTAVFEMHPDALHTKRYDDQYKDWLRQPHPFPIYMHEPHAEIPSAIRYPREGVSAIFGRHLYRGGEAVRDFYTSTFPYMLALGLQHSYERIELYGVDLDKEERKQHRDSVFFWLGKATMLGVDITIPAECELYSAAIYPL
jgi:hypothetical protein